MITRYDSTLLILLNANPARRRREDTNDYQFKSCILDQKTGSLTSGSNIAERPPKISPKGRSLGQDFPDSRCKNRRVQLIINGLKRPNRLSPKQSLRTPLPTSDGKSDFPGVP